MATNVASNAPHGCGCIYVAEYVHHITKKVMKAVDYGYKAWCFRKCWKHRTGKCKK